MRKVQCYFVVVIIICMAWQTVFAREKGSPQEFFQKGVALDNQSAYEAAINMYTKAIELDGNYVDAYLQRGQAYRMGRLTYPELSLADFDKAITIDPTNARAYYQRGLTYQYILSNEQAEIDMRAAAGLGNEGAQKWRALNP